MTDNENSQPGRRRCAESDCDGNVEANPALYLSAWEDGSWTVTGVADEAAHLVCDAHGHENHDPLLHKAMTAFLETILPGTTWQGSDPRHPLGQDMLAVHMSDDVFRHLLHLAPDALADAVVIKHGTILAIN